MSSGSLSALNDGDRALSGVVAAARTKEMGVGMKVIRNAIAVLALTLAIPSAAQAAVVTPLTVSVGVTPAGDATPITFHITGPACAGKPTDITFTLTDGQSQVFNLCDSPPDLAHRFHVTEVVPAGWTLTAINCTGHDTDPRDAFVTDLPTATAFVEFSPGERKACSFQNQKPAAAVAPAPPAPTSTPAPQTTPPNSGVQGEQVRSPVRATARLRAQTRCGARTARVTVTGRRMRQVRFSINGRRVRTVNVGLGVRSITALVPLRRSGPAAQPLRARVTFRNGAAPRTLRATVRRCAQAAVAPQFTG
jgi:hypothetical protein